MKIPSPVFSTSASRASEEADYFPEAVFSSEESLDAIRSAEKFIKEIRVSRLPFSCFQASCISSFFGSVFN
jgi:hypothetical protein